MGLAILIGMSVWIVGDCGLGVGAVWAIRIREICVGLVGFNLSFIVVHECRRVSERMPHRYLNSELFSTDREACVCIHSWVE